MSKKITTNSKNESGVTIVDYGLTAVLILVVAILALSTPGHDLTDSFSEISNSPSAAVR